MVREEQKLYDAIELCEHQFRNWLKTKLELRGIQVDEDLDFCELLKKYENKLNGDQQHVDPLLKWLSEKNQCDRFVNHSPSKISLAKNELVLLERTALNGQVLLMTFGK